MVATSQFTRRFDVSWGLAVPKLEGRKERGCFQLRSGSCSVTGRHRPRNEDRCAARTRPGVFLVVDGVGGQAGGAEASDILARVLPDWLGRTVACGWRDRELLETAVEDAVEATRREMAELADQDARLRRMGATFALAMVVDGTLYVTHVGDCRAYLWHAGKLHRLTKDQTFVQAAIDGGLLTPEQAGTHAWRHVVTNTVGLRPLEERIAVSAWRAADHDRLLLCSDGLTDVVSDAELAELLAWRCTPQRLAEALVELALQHDSHDNVTCVLVDFLPHTAVRRGASLASLGV